MGRTFLIHFEADSYSCKYCLADLALSDLLISKSFRSWSGAAYLFDHVVNVSVGKKEDRQMTTGMHTVSDIFCVGCCSKVGWKYEYAHDKSQKYKEGKYILERFHVLGSDFDED